MISHDQHRPSTGHPAIPCRDGAFYHQEIMESHTEKLSVATRPVAPYIGGKRNLAKRVIERISAIPHDLYAEPFVGMGGVFLRRPSRVRVEVINDLNSDVANLFRILQRHYNALMDELRWSVTSREHFERLVATDASSLTDLERAVRFLYVQRLAFGGKVNSRTFGVTREGPARFDIIKLGPALDEVHERLSGVSIENLPYAAFITRYDRAGALFYLDPPYYGCETDYGPNLFKRSEFEAMARQLAAIQGRFILSLNDAPEVRAIFAAFAIEAVETTYTVGGGSNPKKAGEVLITRSQV
jgi:DNA adenine methylase